MDKVLKQRLIGASILIALAVIFLPMLFEGPEEESVGRELSIELPSAPGERAPVRRLALNPERVRESAPETRAEPAEAARMDPEAGRNADDLMADIEASVARGADSSREPGVSDATDNLTASEAPGEGEGEPEVRAEAASEPESAPETTVEAPVEASPPPATEAARAGDPATAASSGFEVQVASFSNRENADDLVARLTQLGHVASIDLVVRGPSELHRVRTGPYRQRADAERALGQIRQTVAGVNPVIVGEAPVPAAESISAERPVESGYVVQVGSFASRNNAVRLLDQLSNLGYEAFIHEDMAGSRRIWRVRVGPVGSRAEAQARLQAMADEDSLDGLVVSHP
ncbi:SPOR domain-containing protein [Wenzhouxiangella marina]|uniref:Uncharacterized protein n=1 Tax=Wenzhouxiangella marina TaxID=1579979 RepID=A0A0K0XXR8_9GAMM|nr:SPOR domain-containing protein [Wenzhouxiangella marina]AKS42406.1 hypothetical protein WM2015_2041 [Wenzhouxiangella marina]MBB6085820.1 cell division septation protein DedD [Wenzhouxiangella marina]